jgi:triosephosphate isomerase
MGRIIAGNWKMHKDRGEALALIDALVGAHVGSGDIHVIIAPPFPFLAMAVERTRGKGIAVAAQNCHQQEHGAFTGEVSAAMLKSIGVSHCIVGHSERRQYFGETDEQVGEKIRLLLSHDITPIYCCGERKDERVAGAHFATVTAQMKAALGDFSNAQLERIVVAYEPVWAIGTGLTATPQQAQDMHAHIRTLLASHGSEVADRVPILYGGSCKPDNAASLFAQPDVNGGLIGGAALVKEQFIELIRLAGDTSDRDPQ